MSLPNRSSLPTALLLACFALGLAGCASNPFATRPAAPEPVAPQAPQLQLLPPAFPPQDIVGRWGLAAYHKDEDRPRIEVAAAQQCRQPYVITPGPTGGRTFVGPASDSPGGMQDREVVTFDGRVLILRWIDPEVQGRYGTMVYVRCPAEGAKRPAKPKPKPKTAAKPAPAPKQPPIQQPPAAR